jgi:hypothetical protein
MAAVHMFHAIGLFLVATLFAGVEPQPSSGYAVLEAVREAHRGGGGFRVDFVTPLHFTGEVPTSMEEALPKLPGVRKVVVAGRECYILRRESLFADGLNRFRIESESLQTGGNRERRTSVEVWADNAWCRSPMLGAPQCRLESFSALVVSDEVKALKAGKTSVHRILARSGYPTFVGFAVACLEGAGDRVATVRDTGVWTLTSRSAGVSIDADPVTGEVQSGRLAVPGEKRFIAYQFVGRHPLELLPARHPRERREWIDATELQGTLDPTGQYTLTIYDSVVALAARDVPSFDWRSVASSARDSKGRVTESDGSERASVANTRAADVRKLRAPKSGVSPGRQEGRVLLVTGLSLAALGLLVWFKSRLGR